MKEHLVSFFKKYNLDLKNKTIVIGVSTGVDSMVLLHSFISLKEEYHLNIHVAHMNHQKRLQSNEEENFIKEYCQENNIICHVERIKEADYDNFQSYARAERYKMFNQIMDNNKGDYLVVAHHGNDNIETIIMRLIRGSNLRGYSGIDEMVEMNSYLLLRPFLSITKNDLFNYANYHKIKYYQDQSNQEDIYTRNRIRKEIIPALFKEDENVHKKFYEFSETLKEASKIVEDKVKEFLDIFCKKDENLVSFKKNDFTILSDFLQTEVVFTVLKPYFLSKANVQEIIKLINSDKSNLKIVYKEMFTFVKEYEKISFYFQILEELKVNLIINEVGIYPINDKISINVIYNSSNINTNLHELWYNSNMLPIRIRNRKDGDKILLDQGYKKVKDIFIDQKIGIIAREKTLIVEKDDEILAVLGVKKSSLLKQINNNDIIVRVEYKNG